MDHLLSKELFIGLQLQPDTHSCGLSTVFDGGLVVEWASVLLPPNVNPGRTYTLIDRTECLNGAL